MFKKNENTHENDKLQEGFAGMDRYITAPADLKAAAKSGLPLRRAGVSRRVHIRRFSKAITVYAVCALLLVGIAFALPLFDLGTTPASSVDSTTSSTDTPTDPSANIVLPPARRKEPEAKVEWHSPTTFSQGRAEADAVVHLRVGNWLGDDERNTFYDATILEVYEGTIQESITLLQAGSLQTCTCAGYPLFVYGDEFVLFLKKATPTDSPYENAYYICGGQLCTLQVYYDETGEQYVKDIAYFISNQHLPLEVQPSERQFLYNPPDAEYVSMGAAYLGHSRVYKLSDVVPYLKGTVEDRPNDLPTDPPVGYPYRDKRIWDLHHPDDSEHSLVFSVTVPELDNALIERRDDGVIYLNGEQLLGGSGYLCNSIYLADIDGDYTPELCFSMYWGSGFVDSRIVIYDYETRECIFTLCDRMRHDYYLFVRNGVLCVMETEIMKEAIRPGIQQEAVRTGMLIYNGSEISVFWDSEVNANPDRDATPTS